MSDQDETTESPLGKAVDIGTMNIVSAHQTGDGVSISRIRDAFFEVPQDSKKMLDLTDASYVEHEGSLYVLGDEALEMANLFSGEARRPLSKGVIAPDEEEAMGVLSILLEHVLGEPREDGETCYFSIPASPVDNPEQDVVYHEAVFDQILGELGYDPVPGNEALAIVYSECQDTMFTGIGLSFGSGMTNAALSFKTMSPIQFSIEKGGDWIDQRAAQALQKTASQMCSIKEEGIDLTDPDSREERAIVAYYRELIEYALDHIVDEFRQNEDEVNLPDAMPIVVSGGTSLANGFLDIFRDVFESRKSNKGFPIEISEIRQADDPMTAVAEGLLIQAQQGS